MNEDDKAGERPIFYFTRLAPAYRYPLLERLNARLGGRLVVCAGAPPKSSSLQSLTDDRRPSFTRVELPNLWLGGEALHAQPFRRVFRSYGSPSVVVAEESPRSISLPFLLRYAKSQGAARLLWGHFSSNRRPLSRRHPADKYRITMARRVEGCICYTEQVARLLDPYVPKERLFVAPNTLDTETLLSLHHELSAEGRASIRRRLDIAENARVVVFLGRLIKEKGVDRLLDVFSALRKRGQSTLLVIGTGPEEDAMRERIARERMEGVRLLGAMPDWGASAPYLFAADVLLIPGYLGLAINHAFALGVPVVSQQSPDPAIRYHSPEIAYLRPGHNGLLAAHDNTEAMVAAVKEIIADQERYSRNALAYAREYLSLDAMVDGLVTAIRFAERGA